MQCKYDNEWSNCGIMIRANNNTDPNGTLYSAMSIANNFTDSYQLTYSFSRYLNVTLWQLIGENNSTVPTQVAYKKLV